MERLVEAMNVANPALLVLVKRGYLVDIRPAGVPNGDVHLWCAKKNDTTLVAHAPLALLGLAALWERYGSRLATIGREMDADDIIGKHAPATWHSREDLYLSFNGHTVRADSGDRPYLENAALAALKSRGYDLDVYCETSEDRERKCINSWLVRRRDVEFEADPVTALGLAEMYEARGPRWRQKPGERDVWDEAFERAYPDDD